jgi:hypothetical protein
MQRKAMDAVVLRQLLAFSLDLFAAGKIENQQNQNQDIASVAARRFSLESSTLTDPFPGYK